ncbi:putative ankyrin repeat protein [Fusarium oxysporum f. sp. albedinis]|nr:putative ankyrin repeat protein [Fusarium oxysporum f. sp. albedinis]
MAVARRINIQSHSGNFTRQLKMPDGKLYTVDDNTRSLTLSYLPSRPISWSRASLVMPLPCLKHPINYIITVKK